MILRGYVRTTRFYKMVPKPDVSRPEKERDWRANGEMANENTHDAQAQVRVARARASLFIVDDDREARVSRCSELRRHLRSATFPPSLTRDCEMSVDAEVSRHVPCRRGPEERRDARVVRLKKGVIISRNGASFHSAYQFRAILASASCIACRAARA